MAAGQLDGVVQHLRRQMLLRDGAGRTDGQLLEDYVSRRDEAALAVLVQRHGAMVWGVCHRVLSDYHDAEDAFQATFLVLVRRAASIAEPELLANWLYGVAHQTALKARATVAKRKTREKQVTEIPEPSAAPQVLWNDLQPLLDQELSRLTGIYRVVIVLCDLEGKTRKEAARHLGLPEGTVGSRLARARESLAKRLTNRGVALSCGGLTAVLAQNVASAGVPDSVVSSTISAANLFAAGQAAATGAISVTVAALAEGVLKAMMMSKLKAVSAIVMLLGFLVTGATVLCCHTFAAQGDQVPIAEEPLKAAPKQEQAEEAITDIDDLQGEWQIVAMEGDGEKISADVIQGMKWVIHKNEIVGAQRGLTGRMSFKLAPEKSPKEIDITPLGGNLKGTTSPGIYTIDGRNLCVCFGEKARPKAFATAPGDGLTMITLKKEPTTAWGKEIGSLQAGLGYYPGQKRAYRSGETVKLVVRVRNVGKEAVKFEYLRQFFVETPPAVTDGEGKPVPLERVDAFGIHIPVDVNLAPGKQIELYELKIELKPASESGRRFSTLYGTGTFQIQYERVFGDSSSGTIKLDPALSKLATGKLELEVKAEEPRKTSPKDLGKIEPPGGAPLPLVKPGTNAIGVDQLNKVKERLEAVPEKDLEQWVVELERIIDKKLKDGLPSARQVCRTDLAIRLSVAFDDLKWNPKTADHLFKRAQTMPAPEARIWKEAFEALLKKEIGQTDTTLLAGGPEWAVPLVLIPVDALHEGQKYSVERGKKYLARLKQLTSADVSLWKDQVDEFGGTKLDAAVNIILLDDYFHNERFRWESFKATVEARKK